MSLPNNRGPSLSNAHEVVVPTEMVEHGPSDVAYWDCGPNPLGGHTTLGGDASPALRADREYHSALRRWATRIGATEFQASELVRLDVQARRAYSLAPERVSANPGDDMNHSTRPEATSRASATAIGGRGCRVTCRHF